MNLIHSRPQRRDALARALREIAALHERVGIEEIVWFARSKDGSVRSGRERSDDGDVQARARAISMEVTSNDY